MTKEWAEEIALLAIQFLAQRPEDLGSFLAQTGLGPADLRARVTDPEFLGGLLDHLIGNQELLIAFAASASLKPQEVVRARLSFPGFEAELVG
jgi:hypothetical protein